MRVTSEEELTRIMDTYFFPHLTRAMKALINGNSVFVVGCENLSLNADRAWAICKRNPANDDLEYFARTVVELKTPWALPGEDFIPYFTRSHSMATRSSQGSAGTSPSNSHPLSAETQDKIHRAVGQLYGYMSVNHFKYGALCTYETAWFFRRLRREEDNRPILEISQPIFLHAVDHNQPIGMIEAWVYFLHLCETDCFYSSPYTTPIISRKFPQQRFYEFQELPASSIFIADVLSHQQLGVVVRGGFGRNDNTVIKLVDGSKNREKLEKFVAELQIYRVLEQLQGDVIPNFYAAFILHGFVYGIIMGNCGQPVESGDTIRPHLQLIQAAVEKIHSFGVLHGDIRSQNILKNDAGNFRIIDFSESRYFPNRNSAMFANGCAKDIADLQALLIG
jgi:hypothetical protein